MTRQLVAFAARWMLTFYTYFLNVSSHVSMVIRVHMAMFYFLHTQCSRRIGHASVVGDPDMGSLFTRRRVCCIMHCAMTRSGTYTYYLRRVASW